MPLIDRKRSMRGFTMIEMVITLGIMGVALTLGYGAWVQYKAHSCARFAATQFVQDLRFAREQALVRSTTITVSYTMDNYIVTYNNGTTDVEILRGELAEKYGPPLTMEPTAGSVVFDYRGTLSSFSPATTPSNTVRFGTSPGVVKRVTVLATGFSRVE